MSHVTAIAPALVLVMHSFPTAAVAQASSLTKRRFAAPSAQSVTAEVAAVAREAAANRG